MKLKDHLSYLFLTFLASTLPMTSGNYKDLFINLSESVMIAAVLLSVYACFVISDFRLQLVPVLIFFVIGFCFDISYAFILFPIPVIIWALRIVEKDDLNVYSAAGMYSSALCMLAASFILGAFQLSDGSHGSLHQYLKTDLIKSHFAVFAICAAAASVLSIVTFVLRNKEKHGNADFAFNQKQLSSFRKYGAPLLYVIVVIFLFIVGIFISELCSDVNSDFVMWVAFFAWASFLTYLFLRNDQRLGRKAIGLIKALVKREH